MPKKVNWIPEGYHTITPYISVRNSAAAFEFYKKAFGAEEITKMAGPNGTLLHAELKIGNSVFMMGEEVPEQGSLSPQTLKGTTAGMMIYVKDVDAAFKQALDAGAKVKMPVTQMFWGDRYGQLEDPYGHKWSIATHTEDLTHDEILKRAAEFHKNQK